MIQPGQTKWDYKHPVLAVRGMRPWRLFLWVKAIEAIAQLRPRALRRWAWHPEPKIRHAIRWYYRMGRRVWLHEMIGFFLRDDYRGADRTVAQYLGDTQDHEEEASRSVRAPKRVAA
ncbi:hypothetical protein [Sphingomonas sp.]|uniref:hypothetical protein n=1 Tax=Sphingomonas sp. TaxID=28214 RepID=UPI0031E0A00E